jgi:hypothetical protein
MTTLSLARLWLDYIIIVVLVVILFAITEKRK